MRLACFALVLALGLFAGTARGELASRTDDRRIVHIGVLGDSLAEGLWGSLFRRYFRDRRVRIVNLARASTGFNRTPYEAELAAVLCRQPIDLLIVQTGGNDRQHAMALDRYQWARFGSEQWFQFYGQRLAAFHGVAQRHRIPVLWVSMPLMRHPAFDEGMRLIDSMHRVYAGLHGAHWIDITDVTAGPDGEYVDFKPGPGGHLRRFRHVDGVHFWEWGYDVVATQVLQAVRARFPGMLPQP